MRQIQLQAEIMGGAIPLTPDEARDCAEGTFNPRLFPLLWTYYERKVRARRVDPARGVRFGRRCALAYRRTIGLVSQKKLERAKGFEPSTPTLARSCSTPELHPHPSG